MRTTRYQNFDPTKRDTIGRVWKMNPAILQDDGVCPVIMSAYLKPVMGTHFFVCLHIDGNYSVWAPVFTSNTGENRIQINVADKTGEKDWREHDTFIDVRQFWVATRNHLSERVSHAQRRTLNAVKAVAIPKIVTDNAVVALAEYHYAATGV